MAIHYSTKPSSALSNNVHIPEGMQNIPHIIANGRFHPLVSHMVPAKSQPSPDISIFLEALKIDAPTHLYLNHYHGTLSDWSDCSDSNSDSDCGSDFSEVEEMSGESFGQAKKPLSSKSMSSQFEDFESNDNISVKSVGKEPEVDDMKPLFEDDDMKSLFEESKDDDMESLFEESENDEMKSLFGEF